MPIEEYLTRRGLYETYETLEQNCLACATTPDDAVDASWLKGGIDAIQYHLLVKLFAESSDFDDFSSFSHSLT